MYKDKKIMPDYKQGKIYTILCKTDDTLIYVGSTVQSLSERMAKHRYDSMKRSNNFFYQHINDWNDWYIELYETTWRHAVVTVGATRNNTYFP